MEFFQKLLTQFTSLVEQNEGTKLSLLFCENGVYDDYIYGPFKGRENISKMLSAHFHKDARELNWSMYEPVFQTNIGYAKYRFSFTSTLKESFGKRVALGGIAFFRLQNGLVEYYGESVNGGIAMAQLGLSAGKMKRVFEKWSDRSLKSDLELSRMFNSTTTLS